MKNVKTVTLGMCFLTVASCMSVTSCSTKQGTGTLLGAGGGGALGAVIGGIIGGGKGAAIGAAVGGTVGAGAGALIGRHMDKVAAEAAAQVQNAKVEEVTDANGLKAVKVTFDNGILFKVGKYNLSQSRANSVKNFLVNSCGVSASQIKAATGYGENNLVTYANGTENVKASRRVEVYLYASKAMIDAANEGTLK